MSIPEMTRSMLNGNNLPIWAGAVKTACYFMNRVLPRSLSNENPLRILAWYLTLAALKSLDANVFFFFFFRITKTNLTPKISYTQQLVKYIVSTLKEL